LNASHGNVKFVPARATIFFNRFSASTFRAWMVEKNSHRAMTIKNKYLWKRKDKKMVNVKNMRYEKLLGYLCNH
jgi:hypothetical protein